ncbi:MAG: RNA polymerase sigma factor [Bacteroidales bacterium]
MKEIDTVIAGCLKEKRSAQQMLYKHYAGLMYGICLRYAGNRTDAEDVLQEGFVKIFMNISRFRNEGSFEGWMKRIMVNTALGFIKQRSKNQFILQEKEIPDIIEEVEVESDIQPQELIKMIQALPEGSRTVFNLFAIEEYTHKEIGIMLGISEGTSKSQLSRARKMIALQYEKFKKANYIAV